MVLPFLPLSASILPGDLPVGGSPDLSQILGSLGALSAIQAPPQPPAPPPVGLRPSPGIRTGGILPLFQLLEALQPQRAGASSLGQFLRPR